MQTRLESIIEAVINIGSGFFISLAMWVFVVAPLFSIRLDHAQNLYITGIFTITSIIRSYVWRRIFNNKEASRWLASKFSV